MLRKLGVPSRLVKGRVELDGKYDVCKEGDVLGSAQTTLLKMFGVATAEFKVGLRACWMGMGEEAGKVVVLDESGDGEEDGDGRMEADGGEEDDE